MCQVVFLINVERCIIRVARTVSPGLPLEFKTALHDLAPGSYDCRVSVLDQSGQKAAFFLVGADRTCPVNL